MALIRLNVTDPNASNDFLSSLTGKPVGQPPALDDVNRLGEVSQGRFTYVSVDLSAEFGFAFGSVSGSQNRRVMTFDYVATANQDDPADNGIDSWTYGCGYRIGILATETEASAQLGLPALAAKATLGTTSVQIQTLSFGMPQGPVLPVPNFASFDVVAYGLFTQWQKDVIAYIASERARLRPVRIYASLGVDISRFYNDSAPLRYGLRRLQDKTTLRQALQAARDRQIPNVAGHEAIIRATYAQITGFSRYLNEGGGDDGRPITDTDKRKAEEWIQQFDSL